METHTNYTQTHCTLHRLHTHTHTHTHTRTHTAHYTGCCTPHTHKHTHTHTHTHTHHTTHARTHHTHKHTHTHTHTHTHKNRDTYCSHTPPPPHLRMLATIMFLSHTPLHPVILPWQLKGKRCPFLKVWQQTRKTKSQVLFLSPLTVHFIPPIGVIVVSTYRIENSFLVGLACIKLDVK